MPNGDLNDPYPNGHIVYRPYAPMFYGKVVHSREVTINPAYHIAEYLIRWKDGSENWNRSFHLKSLEDLVADHEKKLKGHKKRLAEAQKI